jgi:prepilin-type processing-associated H-X9-DG protein
MLINKDSIIVKTRFTLIELLVIIAIIGILLTLLLPNIRKARSTAMAAVCLSNLSQIGKGITIHLKDNNGRYPYDNVSQNNDDSHEVGSCSAAWLGKAGRQGHHDDVKVTDRPVNLNLGYDVDGIDIPIAEYSEDRNDYYNQKGASYRNNTHIDGHFYTKIKDSTRFFIMIERLGRDIIRSSNNSNDPQYFYHFNNHRYNTLFADGHVKTVSILPGMRNNSEIKYDND